MRPELEPLPRHMLGLPEDKRGYVIPWFVDWLDGEPEFRAMNPQKWQKAIREKLCWVCGERLGRYMTFVAGPMCGINRTSSEPPSHRECAEWSVRNCPFLNDSHAIRREDGQINAASGCVGGEAIRRNTGVSMLWTTETYSIFADGRGGYLLHMGEPTEVRWYADGKLATREQVLKSIETGIPALEHMALQQEGALKHLQECRERFEKYIPA